MSEYSSTSENSDRSESKKASLWDRIKTAKQVAVSSNYDLDVDPQAYEAYVTSTGRRIEHARVLADLMERYVPITSGEEQACILDIAAGTGIISRSLAEKGYSVTATDVSQNALHYLNEQSSGIETVHADMNEKLPFEDESFEGVTSVWANRFIKDTDAFLSDVHRILKPGGVFVWPIFPPIAPIVWRNALRNRFLSSAILT